MGARASLTIRAGALLAAVGTIATGVAFALRADGGPRERPTRAEAALAEPTATTPSAASPTAALTASPSSPTVAPASPDAPPAQVSPPAAPTRPPASLPPTVANSSVAPASPTARPVTDLPKHTDTAVLALAASARLPSGRTFKDCVELPPSHEKWPSPVHLYYEGNGLWLVETHVSEVQVVFDEATATFAVRNFAPASPACRTPP